MPTVPMRLQRVSDGLIRLCQRLDLGLGVLSHPPSLNHSSFWSDNSPMRSVDIHSALFACLGLLAVASCSEDAPRYPDQAMIYCETNQACPEAWECRPCAEGMTGCSAEESVCAPIFDDVCGEDGEARLSAAETGSVKPGSSATRVAPTRTSTVPANAAIPPVTAMLRTVVIASCLMARPVMTAR